MNATTTRFDPATDDFDACPAAAPEPPHGPMRHNATPKRAKSGREGPKAAREPFPVEVLPEPMRAFVGEVAASVACEPAYVGLAALVTAGAAIGNARRIEIKRNYYEPCVFWGAIVGAPGAAKSAAMKACVKPLRDLDGRAIEDHAKAVESYERELDEWSAAEKQRRKERPNADPEPKPQRPACERSVVDDATIESLAPLFQSSPRGLLRAVDELSGMLANMGKYAANGRGDGEAARMLTCFDAGTLTVDRRAADKPPIHIPRAALSVLGTIQPGPLREAMGPKAVASGSAARYLFATSSTRRTEWSDVELSDEVTAEWRDCLVGLRGLPMNEDAEGKPYPKSLPFDREAGELWREHHDRFAPDAADGPAGLEEAAIKLRAYAARFAGVVQVIADPDAVRVDLASLHAGIRLADWFYAEAKIVYAMLARGPERKPEPSLDAGDLLLRFIEDAGGVTTLREVKRHHRPLQGDRVGEAARDALVAEGVIEVRRGRPTGSAGRGPKPELLCLTTLTREQAASSGFDVDGFPPTGFGEPPEDGRSIDSLSDASEPSV